MKVRAVLPDRAPRPPLLFVLIAFGTAGDVNPAAALAHALKNRGHRVLLMASAVFEPLARQLSVPFEAIGSVADYERVIAEPGLWHPRTGLRVMAPAIDAGNRAAHAAITRLAASEEAGTVRLVATSLAFGARIAAEQLGLPLATLHLAPSALLSADAPPKFGPRSMPRWWPRPLRRAAWWLIERGFLDRYVGRDVNRLRAEVGLAPVQRVLGRWVHSPDLVIGSFPRWFAAPKRDWPAQLRLTGFMRFDGLDAARPLSAALRSFIAEAEAPPIVFTAGSAMRHAAPLFERAVEACWRLKRSGVLLTPYREQLPPLPDFVHHEAQAPLGQLLPLAGAIVHHGGIGTCAQALAEGVPQLVLPFAYDQFDNAERLRVLGVGATLPSNVGVARLTRQLGALLGSTEVALSCRAAKERMPSSAAVLDASCKLLESMRASPLAVVATAG